MGLIKAGAGFVPTRAQKAAIDLSGDQEKDAALIQAALDDHLAEALTSPDSPNVQTAVQAIKASMQTEIDTLKAENQQHRDAEEEVRKLKGQVEALIAERTKDLEDQLASVQSELAEVRASVPAPLATGVGGTVTPAAATDAALADANSVDPSKP